MKKWFKFFFLGFFSDKISKEGAKRGYTNVFVALLLAFAFLWAGFVGADMLPFAAHYNGSSDFRATVHAVFANSDANKRVNAEIAEGVLKVKNHGGEYIEGLLINTFENAADKESYSVNGYEVVVDSRPADTPAEVVAYCISNDGQNLEISYEEYLTLSSVARLNFDFKLRYTGDALKLDDETVKEYKSYLYGLSQESKQKIESLEQSLTEEKITKNEYNRKVYELYFSNYYPEITDYESASKVPLLRNYYYHQYIKQGKCKYLFVFDDYMTGSFETDGGISRSFYGFYSELENGVLVEEGSSQEEANIATDSFVTKSFGSILLLTLYTYGMNVFSLIPFIALMPMVVTLLVYSILKLVGVEGISSLGATFKIIGSYVWFSSVVASLLTVTFSFFLRSGILTALPLVLFFLTLAIRSVIFAVNENKSYKKQLEQAQTEV